MYHGHRMCVAVFLCRCAVRIAVADCIACDNTLKSPMPNATDKKEEIHKTYWLDRPRNVDLLVYALVLVCALLVLADFFYEKKVHFAFEGWFGFFAWFGFTVCVALVLLAKEMRRLIKRDEDYYD